MPEQDEDAGESNEAEVVFEFDLVADRGSAEAEDPGKEALDAPAMFVAAELAPVLGGGAFSVLFVRSDHLDAPLALECFVESIGIVGLVANEIARNCLGETSAQRILDQRHFMRASTSCPKGERNTVAVRHCHDLGPLAPLGFADARAPLFAGTKVPSMKLC